MGFYSLWALFFALLEAIAVSVRDWLSLMRLLWLLIFDHSLFPEQLDHSHAIALDYQNQHLKAQCKDFFSFNSLPGAGLQK